MKAKIAWWRYAVRGRAGQRGRRVAEARSSSSFLCSLLAAGTADATLPYQAGL